MKKILVSIFMVLAIVACKPSKEQLSADIKELETKLETSLKTGFDTEVAGELIKTYYTYYKHYQDDEKTNEYIFKAGELAMGVKLSSTAIEYLEYIYNEVPSFDKMDQVLLFLGNIYENQVYDIEMGEKYYKELIDRFPNSKYVAVAKDALSVLGKTPEEILMEIESKESNKVDTNIVVEEEELI